MSICISSDNKFVASASLDKTIKIWEVESGMLKMELIGSDS